MTAAAQKHPDAGPDGIVRWPDGTPKSTDNCFTTPYGVPVDTHRLSIEAHARFVATRGVDRARKAGKDLSVSALQGKRRK